MNYSPKENFRELQKDSLEELKNNCSARWFSVCLDYSMSQIAFQGATAEELIGARRLISTILTLSKKSDEPPVFPSRSLETYDTPLKPKPKINYA